MIAGVKLPFIKTLKKKKHIPIFAFFFLKIKKIVLLYIESKSSRFGLA